MNQLGQENRAGNVILVSFNGAWYTEHVDTTFVTVSQVLMEWGQFFVYRGNIWHSLGAIVHSCMPSEEIAQ